MTVIAQFYGHSLNRSGKRRRAAVLGSFILLLSPIFIPAASATDATPPTELAKFCEVPDDLISGGFLKYTRSAYRTGQPLRIVVFGTSSSAGTGAASRTDAYAARLQEDLQARFTSPIEIINKSVGGQTARQMTARLEDDVVSLSPTLVIWQTGTVDSVGNVQVEDFGRALSQGVEILEKEGIDVIFMNMQYSRRIELLVNYDPYIEMMNAIVAQSDAVLFDRLEMMRHWATEGRLDFDNMPRAERANRAAKLHECLALQLGDMIEKAVRR